MRRGTSDDMNIEEKESILGNISTIHTSATFLNVLFISGVGFDCDLKM